MPVEQRNLLNLRRGVLAIEQTQALKRVEEKGLSAVERDPPIAHAVVELDDALRCSGQRRIGAQHQADLAMPGLVLVALHSRLRGRSRLKNTGDDEVEVLVATVAIGTDVPAKAVVRNSMRREVAEPCLR